MYCDNVSTGCLAHNSVLHSKTKHIKIDFYFVKEKGMRKEPLVEYKSSQEQVTNILTKPILTQIFQELRKMLNHI